ncbi:hypothetical protein OEZ85_005508 [Tetradesmus obliquus]|uniref:Uncharacterized protein n=1 Tax=Tetradesmus obliquus TaxID=3088 RepID=A0ABY8UGL7_TETOB|nr:hypothetical protein OEZ85_005508 [Tetradesmus obliquus]
MVYEGTFAEQAILAQQLPGDPVAGLNRFKASSPLQTQHTSCFGSKHVFQKLRRQLAARRAAPEQHLPLPAHLLQHGQAGTCQAAAGAAALYGGEGDAVASKALAVQQQQQQQQLDLEQLLQEELAAAVAQQL